MFLSNMNYAEKIVIVNPNEWDRCFLDGKELNYLIIYFVSNLVFIWYNTKLVILEYSVHVPNKKFWSLL